MAHLHPQKLLLKSWLWVDALRWDDEQPWLDGAGTIAAALVANTGSNPPWRDAFIGEVAKHNDLIVVTGDRNFLNRLQKEASSCAWAVDFFA